MGVFSWSTKQRHREFCRCIRILPVPTAFPVLPLVCWEYKVLSEVGRNGLCLVAKSPSAEWGASVHPERWVKSCSCRAMIRK